MSRIDALHHRSRVALSTVTQTASNLVTAALGVVGVHLATSGLGPDGYGRFVTVVSFVTLFTYVNDLGINTVSTRELARAPERAAAALGENLTLRAALSVVISPIVIAASIAMYPHRSVIVAGVALMTVDLLLNAVQTTALTLYAARVRNDVAALVVLLGKLTYVGLIYVAGLSGASFLGYVGAYLAGDLLGAVLALVFMCRRVRPIVRIDLRRWRAIVAASFPLGILQVVGSVYFWNGSVILSLFRSPASVAFFGLSVNVLLILGATSGFFMTALVPALATAPGDRFAALMQSAFRLMLFLAVPVAFGGFLLRHQLIEAVAGNRFAAAATPFGLLVIATSATFVNSVFGYGAVALNRLKPLLQVQLPLLALNVGLGLAIVPAYGTTGEAAVLLGCEVVSCLAIGWQVQRASGVRVSLLGAWRLLIAGAAMVPMSYVASPLWHVGNAYLDTLIGVTTLGATYLIVVALLGGLPADLRDHVPARRAKRDPPGEQEIASVSSSPEP